MDIDFDAAAKKFAKDQGSRRKKEEQKKAQLVRCARTVCLTVSQNHIGLESQHDGRPAGRWTRAGNPPGPIVAGGRAGSHASAAGTVETRGRAAAA